MKEYKIMYLNFLNKIKKDYVLADNRQEAEKFSENIQGLRRVIVITEKRVADED